MAPPAATRGTERDARQDPVGDGAASRRLSTSRRAQTIEVDVARLVRLPKPRFHRVWIAYCGGLCKAHSSVRQPDAAPNPTHFPLLALWQMWGSLGGLLSYLHKYICLILF